MAQAIVQMSCTKLRSAIAAGEDSNGDLEEMMLALEAMQPFLEHAEMLSVQVRADLDFAMIDRPPDQIAEDEKSDAYQGNLQRKKVQEWLRRVTNNAYHISDMLDELQQDSSRRVCLAARKVARMILPCANASKGNIMANQMKEKLGKLREELDRLELKQFHSDCSIEGATDISEPLTEFEVFGRGEIIQSIMANISARATSQGPFIEGQSSCPLPSKEISASDTSQGPFIEGQSSCPLPSKEISASDTSQGPFFVEIGGTGRTALARMLFNDTRFRHYSRVWIHNEYYFDLHEIGKSIISQLSAGEEQINRGSESDDMDNIRKRLHQRLDGTKVLIVIDELVYLDKEKSNQFKRMLSTDDKDSEVIVITTGSRTTNHCPKLDGDTCWDIIKQRSRFELRSNSEQEELNKIGPQITKKCRGVPFAAAALGGMLRYKDDVIGWVGAKDSSLCPENLAYISMPQSLKLCFAYCAIFTKDRSIAKDDLIHQWISLGLLQQSDTPSATKLGEQHFMMLLAMSFLQATMPASASGKNGKATILFSMNDMVHGLARKVIHDQLVLLHRTAESSSRKGSFSDNKDCRYTAFIDFGDGPLDLPTQLRALHCVRCSKMKLNDDLFSSLRYLRVLTLNQGSMEKLPDSICQLRDLGYLNLSGCSVLVKLPETFGRLSNLLHIDLSDCNGLVNLPESIERLSNLLYIDLSGCSGLVNLPKLFGKLKTLVHVKLSACSRLEELPQSFGKLTNLVHLDLSGCSGLVTLSQSFGKLTGLVDVNLSGCSGLVNLPESFGKLTSLKDIDLSFSALSSLPESFGDLKELLHLNLSNCYGLKELPASFRNLEKLLYLDLSFWSCFKGIEAALGGLTKLQHLNLSHPCCYLAVDCSHLEGLKEVLGKLPELQHLNLSMFLNPISYYQKEKDKSCEYIESISKLSNLEHLDLSHNIFLFEVPGCLDRLTKLKTLDLSGCTGLESVQSLGGESDCPKFIAMRNCQGLRSCQFVVRADGGADSSSNLVQLEDVNCEELEISRIDNVKYVAEARRIRLIVKRKLRKLKLSWKSDCNVSGKEEDLLEELEPPCNLQRLELDGYSGKRCHPSWWTIKRPSLSSLAEVTMRNIPRCTALPPLGLLPNLQQLVLSGMPSITRIDARELSGENKEAFSRLSSLTMDGMQLLEEFDIGGRAVFMDSLEEFDTACYIDDDEFVFPAIDKLVIKNCPMFRSGPLLPKARKLELSDCDQVMSSWLDRGGSEGASMPVTTELVIDKCNVPAGRSSFLHRLPDLEKLIFSHCDSMTSLPEDLCDLTSLQSLQLSHCPGINELPERLGCLASLRELDFGKCAGIKDFPHSFRKLTSLKDLYVCWGMSQLEEWYETEENKNKLPPNIVPLGKRPAR